LIQAVSLYNGRHRGLEGHCITQHPIGANVPQTAAADSTRECQQALPLAAGPTETVSVGIVRAIP
jgi:hypothetical protein